jgi:hypothetical protein
MNDFCVVYYVVKEMCRKNEYKMGSGPFSYDKAKQVCSELNAENYVTSYYVMESVISGKIV